MDDHGLGEIGEAAAVAWLEGHGFVVLDRNWRSGRRELDIVARDGDVIAFVEVKTRAPGPQAPVEAVSRAKRRTIRHASEAWIHAHPGVGREFRFDVVGVTAGPRGKHRIRHYPDAFTSDDAW